MVDWALAGRTARRLMSPGPQTTREDAADVVRELHEAAATAVAHVQELTGLRPVPGGPVPEVVVVDRPGWVDANTAGMSALLDPLVDALAEKQGSRPGALAMAIGSRVTGVQAGGLLGLPVLPGARAVRGLRLRRPAAARRPEHRRHRAEARRRPLGLPAVGLPARGHPPAPVHRRPVAQGPPRGRDRAVRRGHRPRRRRPAPAAPGRAAQPRRRRPRRGGPVRGAHGADPGPRAARRPRPGHGGDEPGRGARRVRHGRRRPGRRPDGAHPAQAVRPAPQGHRAARPRAAPAARPGAEDEAVRRGPGLRRRGHRPGRHGGLQPRLGGPREPAADRGAHRSRRSGWSGCSAARPSRPDPHGRSAAGRRGAPLGRPPGTARLPAAGARRLQRGSGLPRAGRRAGLRGPGRRRRAWAG